MPRELVVWLHGIDAGILTEGSRGLSFRFSDAAFRQWGLRSPVLSLSMPVSTRPYQHDAASPFFEGLLPEGQLRRTIAYDFRIGETDTFGLLAELGRDCAGALVVQPEAAGTPPGPTAQTPEPISSDGIARRIADLPVYPLGADKRVRVSLAGVQNKLLLARTGTGWALPTGAPSTHILKPAIDQFPASVENEAFCMRLARRVGLRVAATEIEHFGGKPVLVVERFDRVASPSGAVRRVHQEDVNQALGVEPSKKYEAAGGPSLHRVARLLSDWGTPMGELIELLQHVSFVVAVGDADHHAKNISIVHDEDGGLRLAPLYDVMCTRYYPSVTPALGMSVNGKLHLDEVRSDDLVAEGQAWGLSEEVARSAVREVVDALGGAIEAESAASRWSPAPLVQFLAARARALLDETSAQVAYAGPAPVPAARPSPGPRSSPDRVWVHPYRRDDGTPVRGHWRQAR